MLDFIKIAFAKELEGLVPCGRPGTPACESWDQFYQLIENVMNFLLTISIPLAVVVIIYGGFLFMTSGGSEQRVTKGKQAMLSAAIGLAIVFGSYIIITTVLRAIKGP